MKEKQDALEYHLYDSKRTYSVDLNYKLNMYYNSKQPVHISIINKDFRFINDGKLIKSKVKGVEKYYLDDGITLFDLESIFFNNTSLETFINIYVIKNFDEYVIINEAEFGGSAEDGTIHINTR